MTTINLINYNLLFRCLRTKPKCIYLLLMLNFILLSPISAQVNADNKKKKLMNLDLS